LSSPAAYSHSIFAYKLLLSILRPLPSPLRLPLLSHVYASLSAHVPPSSPAYPAALHLVATRRLYDVAYAPPSHKSKKRSADDAEVAEPEDPLAIKVSGEKLVDAVGKACDEYWGVLKGLGGRKAAKGKGKEREGDDAGARAQQMWEQFCGWLEEVADETDDEDLVRLSLSLSPSPSLSLAPPSSSASLTLRFTRSSPSFRPTSRPRSPPPRRPPSSPSSTCATSSAPLRPRPKSSPSPRR